MILEATVVPARARVSSRNGYPCGYEDPGQEMSCATALRHFFKEKDIVTNSSILLPPSSQALSPEDHRGCFVPPVGDDLIRRDLHGPDHLEALARQLAEASALAPREHRGQPLLRHFSRTGRQLNYAYQQIREACRSQQHTGPETEWLLDNFHIIEESLREIREDLPQGYYTKLPKLAVGPLAGYPRVYALSLSLIAHTDSGLDEDNILRFVQAYQSVTAFTIGELWAVPTMLRLALLENLRRMARHILRSWRDREEARRFVEQVQRSIPRNGHAAALPVTEKNNAQLFTLPREVRPRDPFILNLLQLLRDDPDLGKAGIEWLEEHLGHHGTDVDQVFRRESQRLAANQVCVSNCVTSLRILSSLDWNVFFEKVSLVDCVLREDPAGVYAGQDFATRDRYRRMVEILARGSRVLELDVARKAVEFARAGKAQVAQNEVASSPMPGEPAVSPVSSRSFSPTSHVGYYLVGKGRKELAAAISYRPRLRDRCIDAVLGHPRLVYFGAIGLLLSVFLGLLLASAVQWSASVPVLIGLALAALLPMSELAVNLVNYLVTVTLPPRVLPKLSFKEGIPLEFATCVVMPTMLTGPDSAVQLVDRLEVHYLANPDPHLCYALLTDFADALTEHMPTDDAFVQAALEGIRKLNQDHCKGGPDRFFLFHRRRLWNAGQERWMGWERKRGKLQEFNRLLRGDMRTSIAVQSGSLPFPIRFVITLDMDTQLPRESAARLVGTLAHPLNQPLLDSATRRVVEGYGILQPRVNIHMSAAARSLFSRIHSTSAGIDPYTTAVSDVYQDLFGAGSYTGKGIYDVDAFEAALADRFGENTILSHDLIEGNFARCGLVSDIQFLDDFPSRYHVFARREHRWARGDWQILPWLFGLARNPLPLLERWKIFDNLRRCLVSPALLLFLILGWTLLPGPSWFWTISALLVPAWPLVLLCIDRLRALLHGRAIVTTMREWQAEIPATLGQSLLTVVFLVDQARLLLDAAVRTLYRLFVSRRRLLEWETAASTESRLGCGFTHFYRTMWPTVGAAFVIAGIIFFSHPSALLTAAPMLLAWAASPLIAFWVSRPRQVKDDPLNAQDRRRMRMLARKTWSFFETFVGEEDHFLPPDNYQEYPEGKAAHRTSPTNIGLLLLSTLAAHDFGYISLRRLVERLEKTFDTLEKLERYEGHFHNWYDTTTLRSLQPIYISTVDSGNFLGCLLTLKQGLLEIREQPLVGDTVREGLADTLHLAGEALDQLIGSGNQEAFPTTDGASQRGGGPPGDLRLLQDNLRDLERMLGEKSAKPLDWVNWLDRLENQAGILMAQVRKLGDVLRENPESLRRWVQAFIDQAREQRLDLISEMEGPADKTAELLRERCARLADTASRLAGDMDFTILYNKQRHLFAVGYNLSLGRLDNAHYDLLASEAALTSFLAIARGETPRRHWFQLGRPLTRAAGQVALLSWGGTMFEYLMPHLLLSALPETLLAESLRAAVDRQIEYGRQRHVPWGVSESGYSTLDAAMDYQYQSFGVPGLGLRRGLGQDLVVAPYATLLALKARPHEAVRNLRRLTGENAEGPYGFYEAVDYTPSRLPPNQRAVVVRSYMAHHQGMGMVALANQLLDGPMPRRFLAEAMVRATQLLLEERMPRSAPISGLLDDESSDGSPPAAAPQEIAMPMSRCLKTPHTPHPRTHLLSNGRYTVMLTNAGGSWSYCRKAGEQDVTLDVTRWREDCTQDNWGQFCYIRDLRNGRLWSTGHQPLGAPADTYEVIFSADKVEFHRIDGKIETHMEVTVSPESNCEVRRITLTNHDRRTHDLELTSYAEPVLAPHGADLAHPAFGKLFLETEFLASSVHTNREGKGPGGKGGTLLCQRRPRSADEKPIWGVHILAVEGEALGDVQFETDRARFLGRGRTPANPEAMEKGVVLSGQTGAVLDPTFSLRQRVRVPAGASVSVALTTALAESHEEALVLADTYHDFHGINRAFELAWAQTQVELQHHHLSTEDVHLFQRLASHLIYSGPFLRAEPGVLVANHQGQPGLWRLGISGDKPIVVLSVQETEGLLLVRQLLLAHTYWRLKGLQVDLVIVNNHGTGYFEELQQQLLTLVRTSSGQTLVDKPGGVFVRKADQFSHEDLVLLKAAARVALDASEGLLGTQLEQKETGGVVAQEEAPQTAAGALPVAPTPSPRVPTPAEKLLFANGYGGFTEDGKEYVIGTVGFRGGQGGISAAPAKTPAPWINVAANASCGFLISESGSGYTWCGNSQANRLTPWNNDPISDPPGEVIYLRDETSGDVWSATENGRAQCRHGQGYSLFRQSVHGIESELLLLVPLEDPVKLLRLKVGNPGGKRRQLSATFYAEWVLGGLRDQAAMQVLCEVDSETQALLARNPFNTDFAGRVAFADVNLRPRTLTSDRTAFLGRPGLIRKPAALARSGLSGSVKDGVDPCAAIQVRIDLAPGQEKEVVFLLGQAGDVAEARRLLGHYREPGRVAGVLEAVCRHWDQLLGAVQVRTPNPALDLLVNRWLLYQTLSCRILARSAFYQSGGAYGFRDQLQDVMALVYADPAETRQHILRAAGRQFVEGDVQHWWHPPIGKGVRTRFSDDFLWLPLVVSHYVSATGDQGLLEERAPFLQAPVLKPDQEEDYGLPQVSAESGTIYEHCVRSIENGLRFGSHGLPLMGTGDWNDGMNRVGAGGKGETVWGGWFLVVILGRFAGMAESRGDHERAHRYRTEADKLHKAIEEQAWDGRWYRRAYFDDGSPLGSAANAECQIDSLPQTWAVISGRADEKRAREAMSWVERLLVKDLNRVILLFTPPFDKGPQHPGYVRGYVPGIRENGGQYTHAATWVVLATALLGEGDRAMALFDMLNPILHAGTAGDVQRYRVEPYVVAADVYGEPPHTGRGGWTWYTGSSGWLYRVALETMLGFRVEGNRLVCNPCIPSHWSGHEITYRHRNTTYHIRVENPKGVQRGVQSLELDGERQEKGEMTLVDDGREHEVRVVLGE
jgi:cyclic beta-1,2-glucan synthetase